MGQRCGQGTGGASRRARWPLAAGALLGALLGAGCQRDAAPVPPGPVAPAEPRPPGPSGPGEAPEALALTPGKLEAFLRYQQLRLEAESSLQREVAAVASRLEAGGAAGERARREAVRLLEGRAEAEARAQQAAGLRPEEARALGVLVEDVLRPRLLARTLGLDETVRVLEEQRDRLRGDKREELEAQLVPMREQRDALAGLRDVRARHGDAAVDLVLSREAELLRAHDARVERLVGAPAEARPR